MKYYLLEERINEASLEKFLSFMNNVQYGDRITIILDSAGGKNNLARIILDIINVNKNSVTLISCGIYSACFFIFYNAKCKRKMTQGSVGMVHQGSAEVTLNGNRKPTFKEDENVIENWKEESVTDLGFVSQFLNKKEIQSFKKGDDVYFTFKRMREIFTNVEII